MSNEVDIIDFDDKTDGDEDEDSDEIAVEMENPKNQIVTQTRETPQTSMKTDNCFMDDDDGDENFFIFFFRRFYYLNNQFFFLYLKEAHLKFSFRTVLFSSIAVMITTGKKKIV